MVQGSEYPEACSEHEWNPMAGQLRSIAGDHAPQELVSLAKTYMCGQGESARRFLLRFSPKMILSTYEGTGVEGTQELVFSKEVLQPQAAEAWSASLQRDYSGVTVSFYSNEACMRYATFKPSKTNWLIFGIGEACD